MCIDNNKFIVLDYYTGTDEIMSFYGTKCLTRIIYVPKTLPENFTIIQVLSYYNELIKFQYHHNSDQTNVNTILSFFGLLVCMIIIFLIGLARSFWNNLFTLQNIITRIREVKEENTDVIDKKLANKKQIMRKKLNGAVCCTDLLYLGLFLLDETSKINEEKKEEKRKKK